MRLQSGSLDSQSYELKSFSQWILNMRDVKVRGANNGKVVFDISDDIILKDHDDPLAAIIDSTYPDLLAKSKDGKYLYECAILAQHWML